MVEIVIYRNKDNILDAFSVSGHAGFQPKGRDIVCAAISTLVINTINSVSQFTDAKIHVNSQQDGAFIDCTLGGFDNAAISHDVTLLTQAMLLGLTSIEQDYPDFVHIVEEAE